LNQVNHHRQRTSSAPSGQPPQPPSSHPSSSSSGKNYHHHKPNDKIHAIKSPPTSSNLSTTIPDSSIFSSLFQQRAQGFRMDFAFRNAPPRPPVGPCFVGRGLDGQLQELANYRPHNAVEVNHLWKLHAESDLGVPLAPSAMNLRMYEKQSSSLTNNATTTNPLHPEDEALLIWKGHLGDSAMELLQKAKDTKRATARLALAGKTIPDISSMAPNFAKKKSGNKKKEFSRVLDHGMVFFMKKTTYLSNDHTRKVHDFKSLAETKKRVAEDLSTQQRQFDRSPRTIERSFEDAIHKSQQKKNDSKKQFSAYVHPSGDTTKKVVWDIPLLPNVEHWGHTFTHVVMDLPPKIKTTDVLEHAYIAHVEQSTMNSKMSCQLLIPQNNDDKSKENLTKSDYVSAAQYDLDVIPLKDGEDVAHTHFCIWITSDDDDDDDNGDANNHNRKATYLPIPSRVHLSTGRPGTKKDVVTNIRKREVVKWDDDYYQRMAQVDYDVSVRKSQSQKFKKDSKIAATTTTRAKFEEEDDDDDDDDDNKIKSSNKMSRFGMLDDDDDDDDDDDFGGGSTNKNINSKPNNDADKKHDLEDYDDDDDDEEEDD
jgi:hypothetical protein